jgi:DNA-binding transcriptional ArsR family regulator
MIDTMNPIPVDPSLSISDLDTLKVINDPLRLKIFRAVGECNKNGTYCSTKQISEIVHIPQSKLYYHIRQLEKQSLLLVGETRIVSGIVEKYYKVRAERIYISEDLFNAGGKEAILPMLSGAFKEAAGELRTLLADPAAPSMEFGFSRRVMRLSPSQAQQLSGKLEEFLRQVEEPEKMEDSQESKLYTFFYVLYPEVQQELRGEDR